MTTPYYSDDHVTLHVGDWRHPGTDCQQPDLFEEPA